MQLICEAYHLMKDVLGMDHDEMAQVSQTLFILRNLSLLCRITLLLPCSSLFVVVKPSFHCVVCVSRHFIHDCVTNCSSPPQAFDDWNKTELDSFLIEITANILKYKDADGTHLLPKIRDSAGQKGTGKWTAISALEYGTPVTLIGMTPLPQTPTAWLPESAGQLA